MDNRSFTHQIYHLKAVCNQSEKEHSITFEGDLIMSLDGFFEGIVEESLSSDESRKCYVAGDLFSRDGNESYAVCFSTRWRMELL